MSAEEMDKCLDLLRYVKKGDYVLASDFNTIRQCLYIARDWLLKICEEFGIDPRYVYELDPYLERIRTVMFGDIIQPEDHNNIVDALKKLREILEKIEGLVYFEGYYEGYYIGFREGGTPRSEILFKPRIELEKDISFAVNSELVGPGATQLGTTVTLGADITIEKQV